MRKCAWKADELFIYKPMASLRGTIWVEAIAVGPVFRNPSLSLTPVTQPDFLSFLQFFISAEPTLVSRIRGAWWQPSLGATVTAICISFFIVAVYRTS